MEAAKIEGPITLRVPYVKSNGQMYDLLKRFCNEIEAGADSADTVYAIWGLRLTELVQALFLAEGKLGLLPHYPNYPDVSQPPRLTIA